MKRFIEREEPIPDILRLAGPFARHALTFSQGFGKPLSPHSPSDSHPKGFRVRCDILSQAPPRETCLYSPTTRSPRFT
jgi:hypothetical protein